MDYYERKFRGSGHTLRVCWYMFIAIIVLLFTSAMLTSCTTVKYVPVETVHTEYVNQTDTVLKTDTVTHEKETIIREADSTLVAKLGIQLKENERAILILQRELEKQISKEMEHKTDTVIKTDSIQVPYPVEKPLTRWQSLCIDYGKIAIGVTLALITLLVVLLVRKYKI